MGPEYNCGRCAKCLPTMIDLMLAGALHRCRTLPHDIDPEALRRIFRAYGDELNYENYLERFEALEDLETYAGLRAVIAEYLAKRTGAQLEGGALVWGCKHAIASKNDTPWRLAASLCRACYCSPSVGWVTQSAIQPCTGLR